MVGMGYAWFPYGCDWILAYFPLKKIWIWPFVMWNILEFVMNNDSDKVSYIEIFYLSDFQKNMNALAFRHNHLWWLLCKDHAKTMMHNVEVFQRNPYQLISSWNVNNQWTFILDILVEFVGFLRGILTTKRREFYWECFQ